jgi:hypothetical protein
MIAFYLLPSWNKANKIKLINQVLGEMRKKEAKSKASQRILSNSPIS